MHDLLLLARVQNSLQIEMFLQTTAKKSILVATCNSRSHPTTTTWQKYNRMKPTTYIDSAAALEQTESKTLQRVILQLRNFTDLDIWVLLDGIRDLQSVDELVIDNHLRTSEPDWDSPAYVALLEAIGNIPRVGILELRCCGSNPHRRFPVRLLTVLLQAVKSNGLRELVIFRSLFRGTNTDYQHFAEALRLQESLQEVYAEFSLQLPASIEELQWPRTNITQYAGYILSALAKVPTLQRCCMHIGDYQVTAPDSLLDLLSKSESLNEIYLYGLYLSLPQSISLAQAMAKNSTVKRLALEVYDLDYSNATVFATAVKTNKTLESFDLHIRNKMKDDVYNNNKCCLVPIAAALKENNTLHNLELYNRKVIQEHTEKAFVEMLHTNTTLRGLRLLDPRSIPNAARGQIDLYLRLNGRGNRKRILKELEHMSREDWIQLLARDSFDGDFMYYYLRLNPSLCCQRVTETKTTVAMSSWKRQSCGSGTDSDEVEASVGTAKKRMKN